MSGRKSDARHVETVAARRFIEESFPVKEVGESSAKEKNIRHGHISTLHIWWARRPLAASRATAYAALTPVPTDVDEWQRKRDFIAQLSQWENSNNPNVLERARREILEANGGVPPKVLDPFAGGGSYPLEALRLGCESFANDYNPVAVLIEKATLEYPQKFGHPFEAAPTWATGVSRSRIEGSDEAQQAALFGILDQPDHSGSVSFNPLLSAVQYWSDWVLTEARKELAEFYAPDASGDTPVSYIWARTIPCQNPLCGKEIPLLRQYWLVFKEKRKVALHPIIRDGEVAFEIVGDNYGPWPDDFDPQNGTIQSATATCPVCGSTVDSDGIHRLFQDKAAGQRMIAVALAAASGQGRKYRIANRSDVDSYARAAEALADRRVRLESEWGMDPVPDEPIRTPAGQEYSKGGLSWKFSAVFLYGYTRWGDLFNARQKLALITFIDKSRRAYQQMIDQSVAPDFAGAVVTYLALTVSRMTDFENTLCEWHSSWEFTAHLFSRQALSVKWDYSELNPLSPILSGTYESMQRQVLKAIEASVVSNHPASVSQSSATQLVFPDGYFDAVFTDPPYYDSVPYADLSDFFYVWLKRTLSQVHSELFSTPNTPKSLEAIADLPLLRGMRKAEAIERVAGIKSSERYEEMMIDAFREIFRVLKTNGIATIVYAHKSTTAWETVINALLGSGLVVTGAWPVSTEMTTRQRSQDSAALASSIYIIARKIARQSTGFYNDVRSELQRHLEARLHRLWEEGVGGADFFIAAIGSAIEVFGQYEKVMDYEGTVVHADRLLEEVRTIATNYAVKQILHNGFAAEISPLTRFYVLSRWNYGDVLVPFDEANKLAHSCGLDLAQQFGRNGFIRKEKEFLRLLGPQARRLDDLEEPRDLIDVLHKTLLLWEKGKRPEMVMALAEKGHGKSDAFYRVAQAISETLPNDSKEKKLLDGFLAGRERVQDEVEKVVSQGRLL